MSVLDHRRGRRRAPIGVLFRESLHSRGDAGADRRFLGAVWRRLERAGEQVVLLDAQRLRSDRLRELSMVLSMARTREHLHRLAAVARGCHVINAPRATLDTLRERMYPLLAASDVPLPATQRVDLRQPWVPAFFPLWLKRVDYHHLTPGDVCRVDGLEAWARARARFLQRGQEEAFVQVHVDGAHVKTYGVFDPRRGALTFFASQNACDAGRLASLAPIAVAALRGIPLEIFGADFIVADGEAILVDLNAWPSFRTCLEPGAEAIASLVLAHGRGSPAASDAPSGWAPACVETAP